MSEAHGAVILAAGASQRMGTPKASLPWAGTTLLGYALRAARAASIDHVVVVLGPATDHLAATLDGATVVNNPTPESGRSTSIRLGAIALPDCLSAVLIQSVDQPVPEDVLEKLFAAVNRGADVARPVHQGRRGHPVCLAGRLLPELRAVREEEEGLRAVVRRHQARVVDVPVESAAVLWNLNDPAAYAAAQAAT